MIGWGGGWKTMVVGRGATYWKIRTGVCVPTFRLASLASWVGRWQAPLVKVRGEALDWGIRPPRKRWIDKGFTPAPRIPPAAEKGLRG